MEWETRYLIFVLFHHNPQGKLAQVYSLDETCGSRWQSSSCVCVSQAVHAEGSLPERGDLSKSGGGGEAQRAGGEVPAVRWGAGTLLWHVWGVHRGQGPKATVFALFPHFPSQVGDLAYYILAFYYLWAVHLNSMLFMLRGWQVKLLTPPPFYPLRCLQTNGTKGCPKCFKSSMKPGFVWLCDGVCALDLQTRRDASQAPDWSERSRQPRDALKCLRSNNSPLCAEDAGPNPECLRVPLWRHRQGIHLICRRQSVSDWSRVIFHCKLKKKEPTLYNVFWWLAVCCRI